MWRGADREADGLGCWTLFIVRGLIISDLLLEQKVRNENYVDDGEEPWVGSNL